VAADANSELREEVERAQEVVSQVRDEDVRICRAYMSCVCVVLICRAYMSCLYVELMCRAYMSCYVYVVLCRGGFEGGCRGAANIRNPKP
jgi:hypothetical protein